ncbi:MAG: hypothetical protein E4G98_00030 [Promethearchaeota archaeon]|nr:MAG: hypothetical protein E4G98_00030 [Candidatus Lokiarchaeota archaeon]
MSEEEDPDSHDIKEKIVEEKKQTLELKSILHNIDTDGAPQLRSKEREINIASEEILLNKLHLQSSPLRGKETIPKEERPTGNYSKDLQIFFSQLGRAYENRYALWESTFVSIMAILKKMRKYNEVQTNALDVTIGELDQKLQKGLHDFQIKRDEMERFSDIDYKLITQDFKKTMELLQLQIKEIQMRQEIDQLYQIYAN